MAAITNSGRPPVALAPDDIAPVVPSGEQTYDGFRRYGFRVPSVVVSPYSKQDYVSHMVYDHTSVLAFLEKKFNLPALTKRDANANDLFDFLDLNAMAKKKPTFPELPSLAKAGGFTCTPGSPGTIPPAAPKPIPITVKLTYSGANHAKKGVVVELQVSHASLSGLTVELAHGHRKVEQVKVGKVTTIPKPVVLRAKGKIPPPAGTRSRSARATRRSRPRASTSAEAPGPATFTDSRGCGGIGRRAGFRCLCS